MFSLVLIFQKIPLILAQICASCFLLFCIDLFFFCDLSAALITTAFVVTISPDMSLQGFVFFVAGLICVIPGGYHVVYIYLAVKGTRGYDFYNLPLFN